MSTQLKGNDDKALRWAVAFSLIVHGVILGTKFVQAPKKPESGSTMIMAVLVNASSADAPKKAQVIAQRNLNGGGDQELKGVMASAPTQRDVTQTKGAKSDGDENKSVEELEKEVKEMLMAAKGWKAHQNKSESKVAKAGQERWALDIAAKVDEKFNAYASRPRKTFVGISAKESEMAPWIEAWQRKVERVGNEVYPAQARGGARGALILTAGMDKNGKVVSVSIDQSSGIKELDEAARKILGMAEPFEPFSARMRAKTDLLFVTRMWRFGPEGIVYESIERDPLKAKL